MKFWFSCSAAGAMVMIFPTVALAAPSFDCGKAATVVEKTICSDATLGGMDQKLDISYRSVLSRLSPEGRAKVRDGQRQWIKYVRTVCDTTVLPKSFDASPPQECLLNEYKARQEQLGAAVLMKDGKTYYYVQAFRAHRSPDADDMYGSNIGFATLTQSYPQLDSPQTSSERLWNSALAAKAMKGADVGAFAAGVDEDDTADLTLAKLLPNMISVGGVDTFYGHGAAHPVAAVYTIHWLVQEGRELKPLDIFWDKTDWEAFLRGKCFAAVRQFDFAHTVQDLGDAPTDPSSWSFDAKGLTITFQEYAVASYADGTPQVHVSWDELKPYLTKTAPVVLKGMQ